MRPLRYNRELAELEFGGMKLGYLLNSAEAMMKDGITGIVNGLPEEKELSDLGGFARANPDEPSNHAEQF